MPNHAKIGRIKRVELKNFRGWGSLNGGDKPRRIAVDADIVLITGANGYGKSSLLEAILFALTGHREHHGPSGLPETLADLCHRRAGATVPAKGWEIGLDFASTDSSSLEVRLKWERPVETTDQAEAERLALVALAASSLRGQGPDRGVEPELSAGAMSFFQESPRARLDLGAQRSTLYQWFVQSTQEVVDAIHALKERIEAVANEAAGANEARQARPSTGLARAVGDLYGSLGIPSAPTAAMGLDLGLELVRAMLLWREELDDVALTTERRACERLVERLATASRWSSADADLLVRYLGGLLNGRLKRGVGRDFAALQAEAERVESELADSPPTDELVALVDWSAPPNAAPIDTLLEHLALGLPHWLSSAHVAEAANLGELTRELRRLDIGKLNNLANAAWAALEKTRAGLKKRGELERRQLELKAQLEAHTFTTQVRDLGRRLEELRSALVIEVERLARLDRLPPEAAYTALIAELTDLHIFLEGKSKESATSAATLDTLVHKLLDKTLVRFLPRDGFLPVRMKEVPPAQGQVPVRVLTLADGGSWADASTGQKAQLSLAWMLCQATALQSQLPARVLLLDDTSTAFDQGNLARQVTWLRQLAYNPDPDHRWQIFLASHHDELTSRLAELLRPPDGRSLQVLDFTGWQPGEGPSYRSYALRPQESASSNLGPPEKRLEAALARMWARPLTRPAPSTGAPR